MAAGSVTAEGEGGGSSRPPLPPARGGDAGASGPVRTGVRVRAASATARARRRAEGIRAVLFLVPAALFLLVFVYFPAAIAFGLAFFHFHLLGVHTTWAGLQNFRDALGYRVFWIAVRNTLLYAALMIPLTVSLAVLFAALLTQPGRYYGMLRTAVLLPYVTPAVATAIGWLWIFNPQYGLADSLLHSLGLPPLPWLQSTTWALPSVAIYTLWHGLGFDVIVASAALGAVPRQLQEAARVDGADRWRVLRSVTLPLISPTVFFLVIITTIGTLQSFSQIYALSGGQGGPAYATTTLLFLVYQTAFTYYHFSYGAAMALLLVVLILGLTLLQRWISRRWVFYQ